MADGEAGAYAGVAACGAGTASRMVVRGAPASAGAAAGEVHTWVWRKRRYVDRDGPEDLVHPRRRLPAFYFQQMDAPRPQRNRIRGRD